MLAESSDKTAQEFSALKAVASRRGIAWKGRLLMLGLNFIPLFHVAATVMALFLPYGSWTTRIGAALAVLYLAPPVLGRFALYAVDSPQGHLAVGSRAFFVWWFVFQLQILFCRVTVLEEVLRLIPGLYSQWLRCWGARIGRLTYWSPGVLITDRSFLSIGNDVVLGAGVRLNPHVLAKGAKGELELLLAPVHIGHRAVIGGYSLLTAGTDISDDETTRAFLISPPFSRWKDGRRTRGEGDAKDE